MSHRLLVHGVVLLGLLLAGLLLAGSQLALPFAVGGQSMRPTLLPGDRALIDLWTFEHRAPR